MSKLAIDVKNVSKQYRLGKVGTGTLRHDINRLWHQVRGLDDPYLKVGSINDRTQKASSEYVWALRDIDFEVKEGEVLGIIGRNGAGKSTLLKILSKITTPTTGEIRVNGRIASLLEVGTGFHPELSGRENIYLNGSILGMRKWEIDKKFDEIVDFAGTEAYIDTPVKRYSSGMKVRLGFAVAAFLEPEILIVDEVLAVGDAEFQKKCIGRMKDVSSNSGRTILFVSHNMAAIQNLCSRGVIMNNGTVTFQGKTDEAISQYHAYNKASDKRSLLENNLRKGSGAIRISDVFFSQGRAIRIDRIDAWKPLDFCIAFKVKAGVKISAASLDIGIDDFLGTRVAWFSTKNKFIQISEEVGQVKFSIERLNLMPGDYTCSMLLVANGEIADWLEIVHPFTIDDRDYYGHGVSIPRNQGSVLIDYSVSTSES